MVVVKTRRRSLPLTSTWRHRRNFAYALERAAQGKLPLGKLVTHALPADEIAGVTARMAAGARSVVGLVCDWAAPCCVMRVLTSQPGITPAWRTTGGQQGLGW